MSGIRAAQSMVPDPSGSRMSAPSLPASAPTDAQQVQRMQDLLYDILATGVDCERTDAPIELVERFLHEHARSPKSVTDFRGFFAQHGLTSRVSIAAPSEVASLPPLLRAAPTARRALSAPPGAPSGVPSGASSIAPPVPMPIMPASLAREPLNELESHPVRFDLGVPHERRAKPLLSFATAACMLIFVGALYAGSVHLLELRGEIARSEQQAIQNRALIESLRSQTVGLESSLAANGELIQRMEHKSDLVLESLERTEEAQKKPQPKRWR
jgi:hypothetical protein